MAKAAVGEQRVVHYSGRVQGVGFRYTTQRLASRFPVGGYVQNLSDGRVLVVAEGQPGELDRFFQAVESELDRYIERREVSVHPAGGGWEEFAIR